MLTSIMAQVVRGKGFLTHRIEKWGVLNSRGKGNWSYEEQVCSNMSLDAKLGPTWSYLQLIHIVDQVQIHDCG